MNGLPVRSGGTPGGTGATRRSAAPHDTLTTPLDDAPERRPCTAPLHGAPERHRQGDGPDPTSAYLPRCSAMGPATGPT